jgi:hypothetical protein
MLQVVTMLMLLLGQFPDHVQEARNPAELLSQAAAQLPSIAVVDLTGEVQKALAAQRAQSPSPLRAR